MAHKPFVINCGKCRMELYPRFFLLKPLSSIKKVLRLLFEEPERNTDTIEDLEQFLLFINICEKGMTCDDRFSRMWEFFSNLKNDKIRKED